ncbi:CLC4D protein, partial [Psophia crepitans]|nr:CLC4D protein [Psophia crepitans]
MASEITYAELEFKNAAPAPVAKVPPETKKQEHHPQKYPPWLPWLISLLLLLVCIALVVVFLVVPRFHSSAQPTGLQQKFPEWLCTWTVLQGKEPGFTCCPKGWKRFQESCYYMSEDMKNWAESVQNCTGMGSHLVVINSRAEQEFLTNKLLKSSKRSNYYIGLRAEEVGKWRWVDRTPLNEEGAFWRPGEPSSVSAEMCVVIHTIPEIHNWNDVPCEECYRICEAAAVTV